ncbi:homeobox KN domain-containing protein [Chlamydoabsidia padenii]|nr:homeobox KN domain-containing protein [Chlamydoabsidia padenii]
MDSYTKHQIRLFRPVILFHDQPAPPLCQSYSQQRHHHLLNTTAVEQHKKRIDRMLKTNSKIWSELIKSTRQWKALPPLHSPPSSIDTTTTTPYEDQPIISPTPSSTSSFSSTTSTTIQPRSSFLPLSPPPFEEDDEEEGPMMMMDYQLHLDTLCLDKRRRGNLPKAVTAILKKWLLEHCRNPYPTEEEKLQLKHETQLTLNQISNWFINARRRTLPVILAKLNQHYPGIKARRRRRRQRQDKSKVDHPTTGHHHFD